MMACGKYRSIVFGSIIFGSTFIPGTFLASLQSGSGLRHECVRWHGIDSSRRLFTLQEGLELRGLEIRYARPANFPSNAGRIAGLDLVETGKYFIIVDWEATPENGEPGLRWYDKDFYEEYLTPR